MPAGRLQARREGEGRFPRSRARGKLPDPCGRPGARPPFGRILPRADTMNLLWSVLIVAAVAATAVGVMLLARRRAPEGSHFQDGDRAAGVFGVLATGLAVLLGFVVFLAFESYDTSRSGAEDEARTVFAAVRDGAVPSGRRAREALRRARLLRAQRGAPGVAAHVVGHARRRHQPVGRGHVPHAEDGRAARGVGADRLRQVVRPGLRPRERAAPTARTGPKA